MIFDIIQQYLRNKKLELKKIPYSGGIPSNPMHDDIYIVEFPKSGITWLQHIIGNIEIELAGLKGEYVTMYNFHKYVPDLHQLRGADIRRFLLRTFIKSHCEFNPYYFFVVYLIRNPYDVMVSYYNFLINHGYKDEFKVFVKGERGIQAWKRHVNSWYYKKNEVQRMHFIRYEDMLINAEKEITELYRNLGVDIPPEVLENALNFSSMDRMREAENLLTEKNWNYTMQFVGKKNKRPKDELMTDDIKQYITETVRPELNEFYQELL